MGSMTDKKQLYGIATRDSLFKYVLDADDVRPTFFKAFIPGIEIVASRRLDDHMTPVQQFQNLRLFLNAEHTAATVERLTPVSTFHVTRQVGKEQKEVRDDKATAFLHEIVGRFQELKTAFPKLRYDGKMDFVCELASGEYAMVEMQVVPHNNWDNRALAYVAALYGNQMVRGGEWEQLRKVICINILGGDYNEYHHWKDTPQQFIRHYKMQEQLHVPPRYLEGIELFQYSLMNAPQEMNQEQRDWVTFLRDAHKMTEEDVRQTIKTPEVLKAFDRAKIHKLPAEVRAQYEVEDKEFSRYSEHTHTFFEKGIEKGEHVAKLAVAQGMLADGLPTQVVMKYTGLSLKDIETIQQR